MNIGCGSQALSNWINYDSSIFSILEKFQFLKKILFKLNLISKKAYNTKWPYKLIKRINLLKGIPLADDSVNFIYSSHFIEHLSFEEGKNLLTDCYRILKSQGWIRIVCPDLKLITSKYMKTDLNYPLFKASKQSDLSFAFIKSLHLSENRNFLSRFLSPGDIHRSMYDFDSLSYLLKLSGFKTIKLRKFKNGVTPDLELLDNRPEESIYVEAQKC